jgi:copper(I)-binding protein
VRRGAALALAGLLLVGCGGPGELVVSDAHVVPSPSGTGPAGGFAVIENGTSRERSLIGASTPACARVELHRSWLEGDVARMAAVDAVPLPAGGELRLEPGGHHLMLFECTLPEGETVTLRLALDGGETREVEAEVRAAGAHGPHEHP